MEANVLLAAGRDLPCGMRCGEVAVSTLPEPCPVGLASFVGTVDFDWSGGERKASLAVTELFSYRRELPTVVFVRSLWWDLTDPHYHTLTRHDRIVVAVVPAGSKVEYLHVTAIPHYHPDLRVVRAPRCDMAVVVPRRTKFRRPEWKNRPARRPSLRLAPESYPLHLVRQAAV